MAKEKKNLVSSALSGFFWVLSGTGAQSILQFLVLVILARLVSPDDFGVVNAAMIVVGFSMIFTQLGVGPALVQRSNLDERHLQTGFTISVLFGLILSIIIIIMSSFIAAFFRMESLKLVLKVMALVFPLQGISLLSESLLQRELKFRQFALVQVVSYFLGYAVTGITLGFMGFGVWALVCAYTIQNVIKCVFLLILQPPPKRLQLDMKVAKELLYFGGGFTIARIGNYFALQGDNLVVGRWLGSTALGLYGRAYQIIMMPSTIFGQVMDKVLFPIMAKVQHDSNKLRNAYRRGVATVSLLTLPLTPLLTLLAPEIINTLLGSKWTEAIVPFQILAVGVFFRTSYKISDSLVRAKGAVYRRAWRQWMYAIGVFVGAFFGHIWGLPGVAFGVLGALCLNFVLMAHLSLKLTNMKWKEFFGIHTYGVFLGVIFFLEVWITTSICRYYALWDILTMMVTFVVVGITFLFMILLAPDRFIGKDGIWAYETLREFSIKKLSRSHNTE